MVKQAEGVSHAPVSGGSEQGGGGPLRRHILRFHDGLQLALYLLRGQVLEVELQATGQDGDGDPLRFGGRQQEFDMRRRLFQGLQQGVEAVFREHVDFIDEIDLVPAGGGRILHIVHQLPGLIHFGPGRRVNFD